MGSCVSKHPGAQVPPSSPRLKPQPPPQWRSSTKQNKRPCDPRKFTSVVEQLAHPNNSHLTTSDDDNDLHNKLPKEWDEQPPVRDAFSSPSSVSPTYFGTPSRVTTISSSRRQRRQNSLNETNPLHLKNTASSSATSACPRQGALIRKASSWLSGCNAIGAESLGVLIDGIPEA